MLNLSRQVGEEIEPNMNCLVENIENFDNCSVKSQVKRGAIVVIRIKCLKEDEYFKEFSIDDFKIREGYCWVRRVEVKG